VESHQASLEKLGLVARVAQLTLRHPWRAIGAWVALLVITLFASGAVGTRYANNFTLPGTESQRVTDLLKHEFPAQAGDTDQIVWTAKRGTVSDAEVRARIAPMLAQVSRLPHVSGVLSPYTAAGAKQVSRDGSVAFAVVSFDKRANELPVAGVERVMNTAKAAASPAVAVALGGEAIEQTQKPSIGTATVIGLLAAIVVLLITFGSLVAAGLPIVTALLGLGTGIGLAGLVSQVIDMPDFSTELAAMIGLGVGIDYALFIVTRFRENYRGGVSVDEAILLAMDTAGRAVLFAGATVIIALLGQFALGVSFLYGLAIASSLAVLLTMLAALTVLPALLSRFGERIAVRRADRRSGQAPAAAAARATGSAQPRRVGLWARWSGLIERHPWQGAIAGLAIMLTLAAPALALRLGNSDAGNNAPNETTRQSYDMLARGFGKGTNGPLLVVASLAHRNDTASLAAVAGALRASADVASVSPPRLSPAGTTAVFDVFPRSAPQSLATSELVSHLREHTLPPVAQATGATLLVGGANASPIDFTRVIANKLPLFVAVVVLVSALLLLIVFRSVVIPLQAAAMNLLSIGAALGVVVAIFQWGWLGSIFDVRAAPIQAFIPVMLFAIVFGLSMDYEVFLVSRIHEEWTRGGDSRLAVRRGLASTGRVITAAATIMVCVFVSFVLGEERVLKLFGLSLATAVFLDAFVIRVLLLPSVLQLLGDRTWALPRWLDGRLPHIAIDRDAASARPALEQS
jgi:RND superfamily putative drug exporter